MSRIKSGLPLLLAASVLLALWGGVSFALTVGSAGQLSWLMGGDTCDCASCTTDTKFRYECDHTTMSTSVTCATNQCLKDKLYFAKCNVSSSGGACPTTWSSTALMGEQWWHWVTSGNTSCVGVSQAVNTNFFSQESCQVMGNHNGRCVISEAACGGALIETCDQRFGRQVCTN